MAHSWGVPFEIEKKINQISCRRILLRLLMNSRGHSTEMSAAGQPTAKPFSGISLAAWRMEAFNFRPIMGVACQSLQVCEETWGFLKQGLLLRSLNNSKFGIMQAPYIQPWTGSSKNLFQLFTREKSDKQPELGLRPKQGIQINNAWHPKQQPFLHKVHISAQSSLSDI